MHVKLPTLNMHVNFYSRVKIRNMHLDKLCNSPKSNHDLIKRINETYRKKSLAATRIHCDRQRYRGGSKTIVR